MKILTGNHRVFRFMGSVCALLLAVIFSGAGAFAHNTVPFGSGSGHDGSATTAGEVQDETTLKMFLEHYVTHQTAVGYENLSEFRNAMQGTDWNAGGVYVMMVDPSDGQVFIHSDDRAVEDRRLLSDEDTQDPHLRVLIDGAVGGPGNVFCADNSGNPTCAVTYKARLTGDRQLVAIAGYDIRLEDLTGGLEGLPFSQLPGNDVRLRVSADQVTDRDSLKNFVESALVAYYVEFLLKRNCDFKKLADVPRAGPFLEPLIPAFEDAVANLDPGMSLVDLRGEFSKLSGLLPPALAAAGVSDAGAIIFLACSVLKPTLFRPTMAHPDGPWKSADGSIYVFTMDDLPDVQRVIFNGNTRIFEDRDLRVTDAGGRDVGKVIIDAVEKASMENPPTGTFVEYCWDDPVEEEDDNLDDERNPIPGEAPGTSYKVSYVLDGVRTFGISPPVYLNPETGMLLESPSSIFGSGIYPSETPQGFCSPPSGGDDDGCAIAGAGNTPWGAAFGMLLTVSALVLAVSLGRRSRGSSDRFWK